MTVEDGRWPSMTVVCVAAVERDGGSRYDDRGPRIDDRGWRSDNRGSRCSFAV